MPTDPATSKPSSKKRKAPTTLTVGRVEEAMRVGFGIVSEAARVLGVRRTTLQRWLVAHPVQRAMIGEGREDLVDLAESALRTLITDEHDLGAIIWALRTQGKKRGWIDRLPDVVASSNLDALRRIVERLGVKDVTDEDLLLASIEVKAELEAEKA